MSVLYITLLLLHINDLLVPGTFGYADDRIVADKYMASGNAGRAAIVSCREAIFNWLNVALQAVSIRGNTNLVTFNATITQMCSFS